VDPVLVWDRTACTAYVTHDYLLLLKLPMTCSVSSRLSRRQRLFPPEGEEKEKREAVEPVRHRSQARVAQGDVPSGL